MVNRLRSWVRTYQVDGLGVALDALAFVGVLAVGYAADDGYGMIASAGVWVSGWFVGKMDGWHAGFEDGARLLENVLDAWDAEKNGR